MRLNERERKQSERTGWPRVIACIGPDECSVRIKSKGPGDRLCEKCRAKNGLVTSSRYVMGENGELQRRAPVRASGETPWAKKKHCTRHVNVRPCAKCSEYYKRRRARIAAGVELTSEQLSEIARKNARKRWAS